MRDLVKQLSAQVRIARLWIFVFSLVQFFEACAWLGGAKRRRLVRGQAHASVPKDYL